MDNFWLAFGLTAFAGISTGVGSLIALLTKRTDTKFLSVMLGFSAGVMIYVSMIEIMAEARHILTKAMGPQGGWLTVAGFFGGMLLITLIDKLVPQPINPHEMHTVEDMEKHHPKNKKLMRMGLFTGLAVGIHNFPEGLATFIAALNDPALGIVIALAIALHNIPEGIAVSVPIFFATGDRRKAFIYSFLSGLAEPVGALIGYIILLPYMNDMIFGTVFAAVAGIMVYISLDELLPAAREFGEHHLSIYGMVAGMMLMAVSLELLN